MSLAMERAQDVLQRVGDSRYAKANTLQNLAVMHAMRRDFTRAHAAAVTARDIVEDLGMELEVLGASTRLAWVAELQGNFVEARLHSSRHAMA